MLTCVSVLAAVWREYEGATLKLCIESFTPAIASSLPQYPHLFQLILSLLQENTPCQHAPSPQILILNQVPGTCIVVYVSTSLSSSLSLPPSLPPPLSSPFPFSHHTSSIPPSPLTPSLFSTVCAMHTHNALFLNYIDWCRVFCWTERW